MAQQAMIRNTERSKDKAERFNRDGRILKRKIQTYTRRFSHSPEEVFPQFCPSRELDWIEGWDCKLLYTSTGYVEKDCIFATDETNIIGPGLWVFTSYEPNEKLELIRIIGDTLVIHFRITQLDNGDGTSTGVWNITYTALNQAGNAMVEALPDSSPEMEGAIDGLEYFLAHGELMRSAA